MDTRMNKIAADRSAFPRLTFWIVSVLLTLSGNAQAQNLSLQVVVTPSTVIEKDGHPVTFAMHGFIEFKSLADLFPYIQSQTRRWKGRLDDAARRQLARELLRRGIESRVVSMADERPLEALLTHTREELQQAIDRRKSGSILLTAGALRLQLPGGFCRTGIRLKKASGYMARATTRRNISGRR